MLKSIRFYILLIPLLMFAIVTLAIWSEFGTIGLLVVFGLILLTIIIGLTVWIASWWSERLILKGVQAAAGVQMANDRASAEMVRAFGNVTTAAMKVKGNQPLLDAPAAVSVWEIDPEKVAQIMPVSGLGGNGRIIDSDGFDFDDDGTKDDE